MRHKISVQTVIKVTAVFAFMLTLLLYSRAESALASYSGGLGTLDMRYLGYTPGDAMQLFNTIGPLGRTLYIKLLAIDYAFIISFTAVQIIILNQILQQDLIKSRWKYVHVASYVRAILDSVENAILLYLLTACPADALIWIPICSLSTVLKFSALGVWALCTLAAFITKRRYKNQRRLHT